MGTSFIAFTLNTEVCGSLASNAYSCDIIWWGHFLKKKYLLQYLNCCFLVEMVKTQIRLAACARLEKMHTPRLAKRGKSRRELSNNPEERHSKISNRSHGRSINHSNWMLTILNRWNCLAIALFASAVTFVVVEGPQTGFRPCRSFEHKPHENDEEMRTGLWQMWGRNRLFERGASFGPAFGLLLLRAGDVESNPGPVGSWLNICGELVLF